MSSDIERIRQEVALHEIASAYGVDLKRDGDEHIGLCPFHAERTPSFTIYPSRAGAEKYHCFGCGARGDVIDFVENIKNVSTREAISILGGDGTSKPNITPRVIPARDPYADFEPVDPSDAPAIEPGKRLRIYNPKRAGTDREWGTITPSLVHPYRGKHGALHGYVLRHDLPDGGKETPMVMRVKLPDGKEAWSRYPFPKPRPLYGLETLGDELLVLVVEGEKCADALRAKTRRTVVTWAGGTYGVGHADWSPLAGRNVVIWPDADKPGRSTADEIAAIISELGARVRVLSRIPEGDPLKRPYTFENWQEGGAPPEGWDSADAIEDGWRQGQLLEFMQKTVSNWEPPAKPEPEPAPPPKKKSKVKEARTTQQEKPEVATVTDLRTRMEYDAAEAWMQNLVTNPEGKTKPNVSKNWALYLMNHPDMADVLGWNEFSRNVMLLRRPPWEAGEAEWKPRKLLDTDRTQVVMWLESHHLTPKVSNVFDAIEVVAHKNKFDPLVDYLNGLRWDGVKRVETWLTYYLGAEDTPYTRAVGMRSLISCVARALRAGCKVDTMPIFEGAQGARKSGVVRALAGDEFYSDDISDIESKDAKMEMQGKWIIEVAEMHGFSIAKTNAVKKFLTQQTDRYRPPYGRSVVEVDRRCVLFGTINPEGNAYLRDPTGARRFWPVTVGTIDLDGVIADRDQLWAEAVMLFHAGVPWWAQEDEVQDFVAEQEARTDRDVWIDVIAPALTARRSITQLELLEKVGVPTKDADTRQSARIGRVMKGLGWIRRRDRSGDQDRTIFENPKYQEDDSEF